jgi:hypothetical protein
VTGDSRLDKPLARLSELCDLAACYNDPMTRGGGVGRASGKPSSREPGRQQCPGTIRAIEHELKKAITEIERKINNSTPRDAGTSGTGITSMGGVSIVIESAHGKHVGRRSDGTFTAPERTLKIEEEASDDA